MKIKNLIQESKIIKLKLLHKNTKFPHRNLKIANAIRYGRHLSQPILAWRSRRRQRGWEGWSSLAGHGDRHSWFWHQGAWHHGRFQTIWSVLEKKITCATGTFDFILGFQSTFWCQFDVASQFQIVSNLTKRFEPRTTITETMTTERDQVMLRSNLLFIYTD